VLDFGIGVLPMALHLSNDSSQLKRVCHCCILGVARDSLSVLSSERCLALTVSSN